MSGQGPSNPLGARPRMAKALASLNEGLRESADPLYDGWKLRQRLPGAANAPGRPVEGAPPSNVRGGDPVADAGQTIDITLDTLDGTPGETRRVEAQAQMPASSVVLVDDLPTQDELPTEDQLIEVTEGEVVSAAAHRTSVQTDTVRVRVIRYQPFPRWALVVAAALLVFAASLFALRTSLPHEKTPAERAVPANEVATTLPAPIAESPWPEPAPRIEPGFGPAPRPDLRPPIAVSALPPAGKMPTSSPRRRPGGSDFFRDPGF